MWISNQDSTSGGNVQPGWKRRRRRRLLSSWLKVSINRKSRILPNKTRSNCWLATIRFCMASKQQRRAIKAFRGSILIRDQSLTGNDIKRNALSRNLGIYFHWLTFVVTQIISMPQVRTLLRKQKNSWLQNFQFFCKHQTKFFGVVRTSPNGYVRQYIWKAVLLCKHHMIFQPERRSRDLWMPFFRHSCHFFYATS